MTEPTTTQVAVPILSWFDKPIKQSIEHVFEDLNNFTEALDLFHRYRRPHFHAIRSEHQRIKILGMSTPIDLLDIYSPTFVSTTIHGRLYEREWHSLRSLEKGQEPERPPQTKHIFRADEFVEDKDRLMLLGGPGSGKTTFLKYLALCYSTKKNFIQSSLKRQRLPVYIALPVLAREGKGVFEFVSEGLIRRTDAKAAYFLRRVFKTGNAVLLLDSLDEVPAGLRTNVLDSVNTFMADYPDVKVVASCRTADYEQALPGFWEVELTRLTQGAVEKIIHAWFVREPEQGDALIREVHKDEEVASLTETPLLLSLLCVQFKHSLVLPKRKVELYRRCVDALLREWDTSRGFRRDSAYAQLTDDRKERVFEAVAERFFEPQPIFVFPECQLVEHIGATCARFGIEASEGRGILKEIERHHGILERFSAEYFAFSHPSFQEYFAARRFLARRKEMTVLRGHYEDEKWRAVIEFMVELHDDPAEMLEFLLEQSEMKGMKTFPAMARRTTTLRLLYRCMCGEAAIAPADRQRVLRHLLDSQIEVARIYRDGGVFPMAALLEDGVRHNYYYTRKRPTLYEALQPLRKLANEILLSPLSEYADLVIERIEAMRRDAAWTLQEAALELCLLVPLASVRPRQVDSLLEGMRPLKLYEFVTQIAKESREVIKRSYLSRRGP